MKESIKNKITTTLKDNKLYVFLLITLIFFGIFIRMGYTTDTYSVIGSSHKEIFNHFMLSGRFITAIWFGIECVLKLSINMMSLTSYIIAIASMTIALYKLYNIISKDIKSNVLAILISTIIIINPFSVELFMYIERGIMMFAILMCICALEHFIKLLSGENKKKQFFIIVLYMILATFSYQGIVALFVALASVYIIKNSKTFKEFIINNVYMFLCYGIPAFINLLIVRTCFTNARVSGNIVLKESILKIIEGTKSMFNTYRILPKAFFIVCIAIAIILAITAIIAKRNSIKNKIVQILSLIYIIGITILITIVPIALQDTNSIWFVSRSTYTFASLLGIILLFIAIQKKENVKLEKLEEVSIILLATILLIVQFKSFNIIEIDFYNKSYLEKINSLQIGKMIKEYENTTGNKITKISVYKDKNPKYTYNEIFATGDINVFGFATEWSDVNMINYYNNIKLEKVENDDIIKAKFCVMDWEDFDKDEIIFEGDTIHLCTF